MAVEYSSTWRAVVTPSDIPLQCGVRQSFEFAIAERRRCISDAAVHYAILTPPCTCCSYAVCLAAAAALFVIALSAGLTALHLPLCSWAGMTAISALTLLCSLTLDAAELQEGVLVLEADEEPVNAALAQLASLQDLLLVAVDVEEPAAFLTGGLRGACQSTAHGTLRTPGGGSTTDAVLMQH